MLHDQKKAQTHQSQLVFHQRNLALRDMTGFDKCNIFITALLQSHPKVNLLIHLVSSQTLGLPEIYVNFGTVFHF